MLTMQHPPITAPTGLLLATVFLLLNACSTAGLVARSSLSLMDSGIAVMNQETDLDLARAAIPANLKLIESLVHELPSNLALRTSAAQGFYGYAYGFAEDDNRQRALALYERGYRHGAAALRIVGMDGDLEAMPLAEFQKKLDSLDRTAVPALFWTASNWAKWIDMNRTDPTRIAELAKVEAMMQTVLRLDESYYHGGAHMFFGVWYGARPPTLGGNFSLAEQHFAKAREITQGKLWAIDLLIAQYLAIQQNDRARFHALLTGIVNASLNDYPELGLANAIAQRKAKALLQNEEALF